MSHIPPALQKEPSASVQTHYLVDVENLANNWMDLITDGENARVYLFFSLPSPNLTYGDLAAMLNRCSEIRCFQCPSGSNSLDFQLVSYLGFLLAPAADGDRFIILSNDKGYDSVCHFWTQRDFRVSRLGTRSGEKALPLPVKKSPEPQISAPVPQLPDVNQQCIDILRNCLPQSEKDISPEIFAVLEKNKTANLQVVYQTFVRTYGQKRGLDLYKNTKSVVRKIQSLLNASQ